MKLIYLSQVIQKLIDLNFVSKKDFKPCNHAEILEIESVLNIELPTAYREFLLTMGKGAGMFLRGSDAFYKHLFLIQQETRDLLMENDMLKAYPDNAFVFLLHQGYSMLFFQLDSRVNPPIFAYTEGEDKFKKVANSFVDYLLFEIDMMNEIQRKTGISYKDLN